MTCPAGHGSRCVQQGAGAAAAAPGVGNTSSWHVVHTHLVQIVPSHIRMCFNHISTSCATFHNIRVTPALMASHRMYACLIALLATKAGTLNATSTFAVGTQGYQLSVTSRFDQAGVIGTLFRAAMAEDRQPALNLSTACICSALPTAHVRPVKITPCNRKGPITRAVPWARGSLH